MPGKSCCSRHLDKSGHQILLDFIPEENRRLPLKTSSESGRRIAEFTPFPGDPRARKCDFSFGILRIFDLWQYLLEIIVH